MPKYPIKKSDVEKRYPDTLVVLEEHIIAWDCSGRSCAPKTTVYWEGRDAWMSFLQREVRVHLNHYFKNWQNPTKAEIDMFEMITGEKYLHRYLGIDVC